MGGCGLRGVRAGLQPVVVSNRPGSVYIGQVTGAPHQVAWESPRLRRVRVISGRAAGSEIREGEGTREHRDPGIPATRAHLARWTPSKVSHQVPLAGEVLDSPLGPLSWTVMLRTDLFAAARGRNSKTTPNPISFFRVLGEAFRASVAKHSWQLPPLALCVAKEAAPTPKRATPAPEGSPTKCAKRVA